MKLNKETKIIAIVGPTASGKTGLAVRLAWDFGGEIISADSRQVYKYMDIGTGKDLPDYYIEIPNSKRQIANKFQFPITKFQNKKCFAIPYHLIDVAHPNTEFNLGKWLPKARKAAAEISQKGRVPIVAGGTGLYAQALLDGYELESAGPDLSLRQELENLSVKNLQDRLKRLDADKYKRLNNSDKNNKRRLVRYIEILSHSPQPAARGKNTNSYPLQPTPYNLRSYNPLVIGIKKDLNELKKSIKKRLKARLEKENMVGEVERLHKEHRVSWRRLMDFGLEYKYITLYLRGELDYQEMEEQLARAIYQFSRRQMTWYRRWEKQGRTIHWVNSFAKAKRLTRDFFKK